MDLVENKITIIRGEDRTLQLGIMEPNGAPYNLTGASEIIVALPNEDDTFLQLKYTESKVTVVSATAGSISATLTAAQSAVLKVGNSMDAQGSITIGGLKRKVVWSGLLTVIEETF
jgi:hypothetical protein